MREQRALRHAGRARRVHEQHRVVGRDGLDRARRGAAAASAALVGVARGARPQRGGAAAARRRRRSATRASVASWTSSARRAVVEQRAHLRRREARVERHRDRAEARRGEARSRGRRVRLPSSERHAVAARDARRRQHAAQRALRVVERRVIEAALGVREREPIAAVRARRSVQAPTLSDRLRGRWRGSGRNAAASARGSAGCGRRRAMNLQGRAGLRRPALRLRTDYEVTPEVVRLLRRRARRPPPALDASVAPPLLHHSECYKHLGEWYLKNLFGNLHARQEWELFAPIRIGARVRTRSTIVERYAQARARLRRERDRSLRRGGRPAARARPHAPVLPAAAGAPAAGGLRRRRERPRAKKEPRAGRSRPRRARSSPPSRRRSTRAAAGCSRGRARTITPTARRREKLGFPNIVVQGMMSTCFVSQVMQEHFGAGWLVGRPAWT